MERHTLLFWNLFRVWSVKTKAVKKTFRLRTRNQYWRSRKRLYSSLFYRINSTNFELKILFTIPFWIFLMFNPSVSLIKLSVSKKILKLKIIINHLLFRMNTRRKDEDVRIAKERYITKMPFLYYCILQRKSFFKSASFFTKLSCLKFPTSPNFVNELLRFPVQFVHAFAFLRLKPIKR